MAFPLEQLKTLSDAMRAAAAPRTWSRGVMINREGSVEGLEETEDEIVLRVRTRDRPIPPTVVLYPETEEWDCDCGGKLDVCPHAVAAVLATVQARQNGPGELPQSARPRSTLRYSLSVERGLLVVERQEIDPSGAANLLIEPVARAAQRRGEKPELVLSDVDVELDRLLPQGRAVVERREQAKLLFLKLAQAPVVLEGEPVSVETELALPRGRVVREGEGFRLTIEADPEVTAVLAPEVIRLGSRVRLLGEVGLCGQRLERLPHVRRFSPAQLAELTQEVLPGLEGRFPLEVEVPRGGTRGTPRLDLGLSFVGRRVSLSPSLVYGDPPVVRIVDDRPVYLGSGLPPARDHEAERRVLERLRDELGLLPGRSVTAEGSDGAALIARVRRFEADIGRPDERELSPLVPRLVMEPDGRVELFFEATEAPDEHGPAQTARASAGAALAAFEAGHGVVPLDGGGFARLSASWWAEHGGHVAWLLEQRDREGKVRPAGVFAVAHLAEALGEAPPPELERLAPLVRGFEALPEAPLPKDLTAELRSYQRHGVNWLSFLRDAGLGALLADDMGLGKTLQTLTVLPRRVDAGAGSLVVCPTSVLDNWAKELARFRPALRVSPYHGPSRALDPDADVTLTTYALLRIDRSELSAVRWAAVVLDEAQAIKNPGSLTARAAYGLDAGFRVALTGTPVENRLEELWSQMHFTNPGLVGSQDDFERRFAKPIAGGDARAAVRLEARIRPVLLRRMKAEVAPELPPRTDLVLSVHLDERERAAYDAVRLATRKEVLKRLGGGGSVLGALEALLRLRQAACHMALLPGRAAEGSTKVDRLLEVLEEAVKEGHKALVFSQWTSMLDLVEPALKKASIAFTRLDGSTRDRGEVVARFQDQAGPPVLLLSLKAGGTGLNLTAADHVFLLDPWWNPAVEEQAADRAHRIGQDRPVFVHRLVAKDTVEERLLALQAQKRALADQVISAGAASLTREDLLGLLD